MGNAIKKYPSHNCVESCIAYLCDYHGIDFRPMFLYSWDFWFKRETRLEYSIYWHSLVDWNFKRYYEISETYFNLSFTSIEKNLDTVMNEIIKGNIVLINSDTYNLSWNVAFHKQHIQHVFLVKYDFSREMINIIDPFCLEKILEVENLICIKIIECYRIQKESSDNKRDFLDLKRKYADILKSNIDSGDYSSIEYFSESLKDISMIEQLTNNKNDLPNSVLVRRLSGIVNSRYNTECLFEYMKLPNDLTLEMGKICKDWEEIKNMFIKIILSNNLKLLDKITGKLSRLAKKENKLCNKTIENILIMDEVIK